LGYYERRVLRRKMRHVRHVRHASCQAHCGTATGHPRGASPKTPAAPMNRHRLKGRPQPATGWGVRPATIATMTKQDHVTITLRARYIGTEPSVGTLVASLNGRVVYQILEVWRVRRAGDQRYAALRLVCRRLIQAEVPDGAEVLPWPRDPRAPRGSRRAADRQRVSADPGPPEPPAARLARIRAKTPVLLGLVTEPIR
jgi:hypothetical protein